MTILRKASLALIAAIIAFGVVGFAPAGVAQAADRVPLSGHASAEHYHCHHHHHFHRHHHRHD